MAVRPSVGWECIEHAGGAASKWRGCNNGVAEEIGEPGFPARRHSGRAQDLEGKPWTAAPSDVIGWRKRSWTRVGCGPNKMGSLVAQRPL